MGPPELRLSLRGRVIDSIPDPRHHLKFLPIPAEEEAEGPGPHVTSLKDVKAHGPVQDFVIILLIY